MTPTNGTAKTLRWLHYADEGKATFTTDLALTRLGNMGYWEMEDTGQRQPVEPYVMQGGFRVTDWPVFRSRLTSKGCELLAQLEALTTASTKEQSHD